MSRVRNTRYKECCEALFKTTDAGYKYCCLCRMSTPRAGTPVTRPTEQELLGPDREQQPLSPPQNRRPIAAQSSLNPPVLDHPPSSVGKEDLTKAKDGDRQGNEDYDSVFQSSSLDTTAKPRNRRNRHQVLYHMVVDIR
jgi:hypothetical protein